MEKDGAGDKECCMDWEHHFRPGGHKEGNILAKAWTVREEAMGYLGSASQGEKTASAKALRPEMCLAR